MNEDDIRPKVLDREHKKQLKMTNCVKSKQKNLLL